MADQEYEPDWEVTLRPASPGSGDGGNTGMYEVICGKCGDDPALDYGEPVIGPANEMPAQKGLLSGSGKRPQQDSNLRSRLRRPMLYPLSYGGSVTQERVPAKRPCAWHAPGRGAITARQALPSRA